MGIKIKGLDRVKKQLQHMQTERGKEELLTNRICELVPEAKAVIHKMKFSHQGSTVNIDFGDIAPDLQAKIKKALSH